MPVAGLAMRSGNPVVRAGIGQCSNFWWTTERQVGTTTLGEVVLSD